MEVFERVLEFKRFQPLPHLGDLSQVIVAGPHALGAVAREAVVQPANVTSQRSLEEAGDYPMGLRTVPGQS